jgi:Fungal chitosanase of glycosyl hydrolase group 75
LLRTDKPAWRAGCAFLAFLTLGALHGADAQQKPASEDLASIIAQLTARHRQGSRVEFSDRPAQASRCGMLPADMEVHGDSASKSFPVLVERQRGRVSQLFARLGRLTVDADGAGRAYHPDDPFGENRCSAPANPEQPACALDSLSNAGMRLFLGSTRLTKSSPPADGETFLKNWQDFWPLIRERKLKPFSLKTIVGADGPRDYNLLHWPERNLTFAFNTKIVPATRNGYPCRHERPPAHAGYFLSATTLKRAARIGGGECQPVFIDSETVPFFVVPKEKFDRIALGDLAIGFLATPTSLRIVYGIAADTGPFDHFGEGSIAFNKTLLGVQEQPQNAGELDALDIDLSHPARLHGPDASLAVLLLGGTRRLLHGDFSAANVQKVGEAQLKKWNAGAEERARACLEIAP